MRSSYKRPKLNEPEPIHPAEPPMPLQPRRLTQDQELTVIVSALRNVVAGTATAASMDFNSLLPPLQCASTSYAGATGSSYYRRRPIDTSPIWTPATCAKSRAVLGAIFSRHQHRRKRETITKRGPRRG
ncbi:hypothetical protein GBA52_027284 [Prunus armeniaca]|nr:hypothetical protein GBA52_027284 [Prunus armeniaca]